ncbi:uncharacterized protein [Panulirus ornatus]|uniref:uncharacterized protein isoform X2 n=1 Tax=Panulirus ornatus TaxID=150431 RepID=UPI003A8847A1
MICRPKCEICGGCFDGENRLPLLLVSCGHTCCKACLELLTQHRGYRCPTCRKQQPEKGVSALQEHKNEDNMEPENNEEMCYTHKGVRVSYWCSPCNKPACGECIVEDHPNSLHKARKISCIIEELSRDVHSSITKVMTTIEKFEKHCKEHDTFIEHISGLSENIKRIIGKLMLSVVVLNSQAVNCKDTGEDIKDMEKMTEEIISEVPESPQGIKGIKALQKYTEKVQKLQKHVMAKAQVPNNNPNKAETLLNDVNYLRKALNTQASSFTKQVCALMIQELEVGAAGGKGAKLQWEDNRLHLYCLTQQNKHSCTKKKCYLKWNVVESLLKEEKTTVFFDMSWDKGKCQGRMYLTLQNRQPSGQHLLEMCTGKNTSLLNANLSSKEVVAGGEGILLGVYYLGQKEQTNSLKQPTQQHDCIFHSGDVISVHCEETKETKFWLLTQDSNTGTPLNSTYTFIGCLSSGKELLTKAASQENLADICITNCGAVIHI